MTGGIEPQRAIALPNLQRLRRFAGSSALVSGAARSKVLRSRGAEIRAEAETFVRQRHCPVGIAFTRGDAIAETGNEDVAHHNLGRDPLRRLGSGGDVYTRNCNAAIAYSETDGLGAIERGLLRTIAISEGPGASSADRNCAG